VFCSNGGELEIGCDAQFGPCFGGNINSKRTVELEDIAIHTDSNIKKDSFCDFGYSYQHPGYLKGTHKARNILAGSYYFETVEIEVYAKSN